MGGASGELQLWNFASGLLLHTFQVSSSPVRCVEPAPALDVVGVGLADGCAPGCFPAANGRWDQSIGTLEFV